MREYPGRPAGCVPRDGAGFRASCGEEAIMIMIIFTHPIMIISFAALSDELDCKRFI
jgi:hypothetical protein